MSIHQTDLFEASVHALYFLLREACGSDQFLKNVVRWERLRFNIESVSDLIKHTWLIVVDIVERFRTIFQAISHSNYISSFFCVLKKIELLGMWETLDQYNWE